VVRKSAILFFRNRNFFHVFGGKQRSEEAGTPDAVNAVNKEGFVKEKQSEKRQPESAHPIYGTTMLTGCATL